MNDLTWLYIAAAIGGSLAPLVSIMAWIHKEKKDRRELDKVKATARLEKAVQEKEKEIKQDQQYLFHVKCHERIDRALETQSQKVTDIVENQVAQGKHLEFIRGRLSKK